MVKNNRNFETSMRGNTQNVDFRPQNNHFFERRDNKNINFGLEKFFGKRKETRNKIEKDKGLVRHINALGGIENTFESNINFKKIIKEMKESLCTNELQHLLLKRDPGQRNKELQQTYLPQEFQHKIQTGRSEQPMSHEGVDHDIARDIDHVQRQRMLQTQYINDNRQFLQKFDSINQMIKNSMNK